MPWPWAFWEICSVFLAELVDGTGKTWCYNASAGIRGPVFERGLILCWHSLIQSTISSVQYQELFLNISICALFHLCLNALIRQRLLVTQAMFWLSTLNLDNNQAKAGQEAIWPTCAFEFALAEPKCCFLTNLNYTI